MLVGNRPRTNDVPGTAVSRGDLGYFAKTCRIDRRTAARETLPPSGSVLIVGPTTTEVIVCGMRFLSNLLNLLTFFLATAFVLNAPLMLIGFLLRKRVDRRIIRAVLAVGFAAANAQLLWRMEWFDVWRHGIPPIGYIIAAYLPYTAVFGLLGWFVGGFIAPATRRGVATND
jgi:hypothetical protein